MANSIITFVFNLDLVKGESVAFDYIEGAQTFPVLETWESNRFQSGMVATGVPTAIPGERSAINFAASFAADYNVTGDFKLKVSANEVKVEATRKGVTFANPVTSPKVTTTIGTGTFTPAFSITDVSFEAVNCDRVKVVISTSETATGMTSPINKIITTNPFDFEYDRNLSFNLDVKKGTATASRSVSTPARIFPSGIMLDIVDNPAGSSVTIRVGGYGLTFKYSLDGTEWYSSNFFPSLLGGQYTAYVKDQYGCVTQRDFEVDGFGINSAFFYLPTANSLRFAARVPWSDCSNYKNDFNTLSCEAEVPKPHRYLQRFQTCDKVLTQFKSNYELNTADVNGRDVTVAQITDYMRRKDKRDAISFRTPDGRTGVYFETGLLYHYDTSAPSGDYSLYGNLPEWGKAGNFIQFENGVWYLIEDVLYDDQREADYLVIGMGVLHSENDEPRIVASFYNLHNYEVFEFTVDFAPYVNRQITVNIRASDPSFDGVTFQSELIDVRIRHEHTIEIDYSNDTNTDVFYASGISNKMRIPIERVDGKPQDTAETYDTDDSTILLNADVRELDTFEFQPVPKQIMRKIVEALSHRNVTMDNVPYVRSEIGVEGALGETNLYIVSATMIKSASFYRTGGLTIDETGQEIPGLIPTGTGYVKYQ